MQKHKLLDVAIEGEAARSLGGIFLFTKDRRRVVGIPENLQRAV